MLRLIIMRHAKSDWQSGAQSDHERPLNRRGRRDAPRMAQQLAKIEWTPARVLSSDAQRTRETWAAMADALPGARVEFLNELYLAGLDAIASAVASFADEAGTVMVLGHNPGWEDAASELAGISITLTTANAVLLQTEAPSWAEAFATERQFELHAILRPRELDT